MDVAAVAVVAVAVVLMQVEMVYTLQHTVMLVVGTEQAGYGLDAVDSYWDHVHIRS